MYKTIELYRDRNHLEVPQPLSSKPGLRGGQPFANLHLHERHESLGPDRVQLDVVPTTLQIQLGPHLFQPELPQFRSQHYNKLFLHWRVEMPSKTLEDLIPSSWRVISGRENNSQLGFSTMRVSRGLSTSWL